MQDVSKILTRKYYGKKDPFRSREFRQPRWMELLAVLLFTVSGLGEGKSINVVLGGLPKAVTLAFVGLAGLEFFIRGDFDRLKKLVGPSGLYILYLAVLAACQTRQWSKNAVCEYCHKRRIILGAENNEQSYKNCTLMSDHRLPIWR